MTVKALHAEVSKAEHDIVRMRAAELGMTIAAYLRELVKFDIDHKVLKRGNEQ